MNHLTLIGNLTRDPEVAATKSGVPVCRFAIAVNRNYTSVDGNREADFFNVTAWRAQAESCGKYLKRGSKVAVIGSLQNRAYEDKQGVKRTVTDIIADEVEFLTPVGKTESRQEKSAEQVLLTPAPDEEDLPF